MSTEPSSLAKSQQSVEQEGYLGEPRAPSLTQLKERERVQGCRTAAVRLLVPAETNDHRLGADNRKYSLQFWLPEI